MWMFLSDRGRDEEVDSRMYHDGIMYTIPEEDGRMTYGY